MKGFFVAFDALPKESLMFLHLWCKTQFSKNITTTTTKLISKTYFPFVIPNIKVPFCGSLFGGGLRSKYIFSILWCRVEKKGNNKYKQHNSIQEVETMNQGLFVCMSLCEWKKVNIHGIGTVLHSNVYCILNTAAAVTSSVRKIQKIFKHVCKNTNFGCQNTNFGSQNTLK